MSEAELMIDDEAGELIETKTGERPLSKKEEEEFKQDCQTILNELGSFVRVGLALRRIKEKRLYRDDYGTFEECVKVLFDLAARRAQQLMQATNVMDLLESEIGQNAKHVSHFDNIMPKNERQALSLLRAPEERRAEIWQKTVEKYGDKVTARCVTNTIREEISKSIQEIREKTKRTFNESNNDVPDSFKLAFDTFLAETRKAYRDDWKGIPKKEVIKRIKSLLYYVESH